ncbi:hypothetical protein C8A00DRAFT_13501 [Chaetomidium leptoderma]|uniref:Uncharacterized protein n=1 Tax=Chaetomidium leptoderma TaxID=669021 RepID=A0AAN6ZYF8_9PEZI|nr:hypothetical protein C8A00DRAFT_13501 [Chaetomidium leptoderma]
MATHSNPFHASFARGKRRTLAEIDAATKGSNGPNGFKALHRQPVQPGTARVPEWLSHQGIHLVEEDVMELDKPRPPQSIRHTPAFAPDGARETAGQWPRSQTARAGTRAKPPPSVPHTPPSSRHFSSHELKRKVYLLDDSEEDVIIVPPPPSAPRRGPKPIETVDLTTSNHPTRRTSFLGNRDDDVVIIDPPAAEMRRQLRPLLLGSHTVPVIPGNHTVPAIPVRPQKRPKRTHTNLAPAPERPMRRNREALTDERTAPEANAAETSVVLQSVESMTHFFTLATEIRDKIYRHLLVSQTPINVHHLWTELARRSSRRRGTRSDDVDTTIDARILTACRQTAVEGTRILYSENTFLYLLRDPSETVENVGSGGRRSQRNAARGQREREGTINLARYGHLIRHMAIELEPNRTDTSYAKLMCAALETLAPAGGGSPLLPSPPRPLCGPIHLHTLTLTVSPLFESSQRAVRAPGPGNQDVLIHEGRFLSVVGFFSRGAPVLKALQRLNVDFLRLNVHVNSDLKDGDLAEDEADSDAESDDNDSDTSSVQAQRPKKRHLETTIDLRCLPRHMETLSRNGLTGRLWANDVLMQEKRRQQGAKAEDALAHLRRHIEEACLQPESVLRGGVWEDHGAAERRRAEQRAKAEARFDADAYDAEGEGGGEDSRVARGMKSLIISIDRVGDELRAYRA